MTVVTGSMEEGSAGGSRVSNVTVFHDGWRDGEDWEAR